MREKDGEKDKELDSSPEWRIQKRRKGGKEWKSREGKNTRCTHSLAAGHSGN